MVSIGIGSVLLPFQLLAWKTAVCCGNSHVTCAIQLRGVSPSTISAVQMTAVCVWKLPVVFGRACVAFLWSRQGLHHAKEHAQHGGVGRCLQVGLTPRACRGYQHGQRLTSSLGDFIVTHRTDQPFPVIFLKLLCQMAVVPRGGMALGLRHQFWSCANISG